MADRMRVTSLIGGTGSGTSYGLPEYNHRPRHLRGFGASKSCQTASGRPVEEPLDVCYADTLTKGRRKPCLPMAERVPGTLVCPSPFSRRDVGLAAHERIRTPI